MDDLPIPPGPESKFAEFMGGFIEAKPRPRDHHDVLTQIMYEAMGDEHVAAGVFHNVNEALAAVEKTNMPLNEILAMTLLMGLWCGQGIEAWKEEIARALS